MIKAFVPARSRTSRFAHDVRAVSAVEFAIVLPLMVAVFLGGNELSQAISVKRKDRNGDPHGRRLVTQDSAITATEMSTIFAASTSVVSPFDASKLKIIVSQVKVDSNGVAKIDWSRGFQIAGRTPDTTITLPTGLNIAGSCLTWAEASYPYTRRRLPHHRTLTLRTMYLRPR